MRSFWLFPVRLVAICLLVLYGVPAMLGPHWHQHDNLCSHCDLDRPSIAVHECQSDVPHSPHRCQHGTQSSRLPEPSKRTSSPKIVLTSDDCVVCAFYSQAQTEDFVSTAICSGQFNERIVTQYSSTASARIAISYARGPPSKWLGEQFNANWVRPA